MQLRFGSHRHENAGSGRLFQKCESYGVVGADMVDASMFMQFVNNYEPGLAP